MGNAYQKFESSVKNLFGQTDNIEEIIQEYRYTYLMFDLDKNIHMDVIINFIDNYHDLLINNLLKNNNFINNILRNGTVVYKNREDLINKDYIENILIDIKNKKYNKKSVIVIMEILKIFYLYGNDNKDMNIILSNNINNIVENVNLVSDGDSLLTKEEKIDKSNILIRWSEIVGNDILSLIFQFELLKERLYDLLFLNRDLNAPYSEELLDMVYTCDIAIKIRNKGDMPISLELINKINKLFNSYELINRNLLLKSLENDDFKVVHFIQTKEVNYQLIGDRVVNVNEQIINEEQRFNKSQNNYFINSYLEYVKKEIEKQLKEPFDIKNLKHRKLLEEYLVKYNDVFNNKPLERLPIDIAETGEGFFEYIRKSDNRLSCSILLNDNIKAHLNRKIGFIVKPKDSSSIISISRGYTSKKDFYDFQHDSVPSRFIIDEFANDNSRVSEVVLDASRCDIVGIALIGNNQDDYDRANKLSELYNIPVINYDFQKKK